MRPELGADTPCNHRRPSGIPESWDWNLLMQSVHQRNGAALGGRSLIVLKARSAVSAKYLVNTFLGFPLPKENMTQVERHWEGEQQTFSDGTRDFRVVFLVESLGAEKRALIELNSNQFNVYQDHQGSISPDPWKLWGG